MTIFWGTPEFIKKRFEGWPEYQKVAEEYEFTKFANGKKLTKIQDLLLIHLMAYQNP